MKAGKRWFRFFRNEVLPRGTEVFLHRNVIISLVLAIAASLLVWRLPRAGAFPNTTFAELTTATLAFSGLSFGGAISAIVLAISLPTGRMFDTMVVNSSQAERRLVVDESGVRTKSGELMSSADFQPDFRSLYLDLVFVFQMAAVAQLMLALASMLVLACIGGNSIRPPTADLASAIGIATMTFFSSYAVMQLASSLKALSSVARNRDRYHRRSLVL